MRVHTPRRWGEPFSAGVLVFSTLSSRPLRTSWLIVGMGGLDLLPALGWCSRLLRVVLCGRAACGGAGCRSCLDSPILPARHPPVPGVGRVARPGPADGGRTGLGRPSRLGAAAFRTTISCNGQEADPGGREASASG